jgi:hypothetical protein
MALPRSRDSAAPRRNRHHAGRGNRSENPELCMTNENVIDLYNRVGIGTPVVVLGPRAWRLAGRPG